MDNLIILTGPTAVGKTKLSINLAKEINGEIISADCMQVYKGMDIGTAKITAAEMENVPHHLIDVIEPTDEFNVKIFKDMAKNIISDIQNRGKIPIICGGTGFYIQAVLYDIDFDSDHIDIDLREELNSFADEFGNDKLHDRLREIDEKSAEIIPANNRKRVIRAIEYYKMTGEKISDHNEAQRNKKSPYNFAYFVLDDDRNKLYDRINKRVDGMMLSGLEEEVRGLIHSGARSGMTSMDGIGYKEITEYLDGKKSLEEAVNLIKQNSRHYAKRQLTWFRRERDVIWLDRHKLQTDEIILNAIKEELAKKEIIKSV